MAENDIGILNHYKKFRRFVGEVSIKRADTSKDKVCFCDVTPAITVITEDQLGAAESVEPGVTSGLYLSDSEGDFALLFDCKRLGDIQKIYRAEIEDYPVEVNFTPQGNVLLEVETGMDLLKMDTTFLLTFEYKLT
jgi:hypothetical protein